MYERNFHLNARPFTATAFVQNYFAAESIHNALAQSKMCIDRASGPVVVTGTSGTGKSLLLGMLAEQYKTEFKVISIACARLAERKDLLQNILFELERPYRDLSEGELRLSLIDYLKMNENENKGMLLLVDEAHSLSTELLDELRLITNFIKDGQPRVFLVMAGSPALEDHLIDTRSESFNQRIAARCYLRNLSRNETIEYVLTHIEKAGGNGEELFTAEALNKIHQASDGCPRVINQICDQSMMLAASLESPRITAEIAAEAWRDVQAIPGQTINDSAPSVKSCSEDEMMVIEFGHLDADETAAGQSAVEEGELHIEGEAHIEFGPIDSAQDTIPTDDSIQLMDVSSEEQQPRADLADFDYSITGDGDDIDRPQNFSNPFDEDFSEEEQIASTFHPVVSEHNLSSLTLMPEQLGFLDDIPAGPPVTASMIEPVELQLQQSTPAEESELRISESCLPDLDQLEDDVRLLQQHLNVSSIKEDFSESPMFSSKATDQPIEELMQQHSVVEETLSEAPDSAEEVLQIKSSHGSDEKRIDDRDIMIIDGIGQLPEMAQSDTSMTQEFKRATSTGNATRMDYNQLFQQLRDAQQ